MLPIYEAIDILEVIDESAGHTRPWVVTANTPNGLRVYVVKLYSQSQVQDKNIITREVVSHLIASKFELSVPEIALIDIPEELVFQKGLDEQIQFNQADSNYKFASLRLDRPVSVMHGISAGILRNKIDLDTLYAFDNLIRNSDRGRPKVNLLFSNEEIYLIDHELALQFGDIDITRSDILQADDKYTRYHFAYPYLRKMRGIKKQNIFNNFQEYLRLMNINMLNPYFTQLYELGFPDYSDNIINWIGFVKQFSTIFVERLKSSLR